jgi:hypothetical protein
MVYLTFTLEAQSGAIGAQSGKNSYRYCAAHSMFSYGFLLEIRIRMPKEFAIYVLFRRTDIS